MQVNIDTDFLALPFDIQVAIAARISNPRDVSALLQACKLTSTLRHAPQLAATWLIIHRSACSYLL